MLSTRTRTRTRTHTQIRIRAHAHTLEYKFTDRRESCFDWLKGTISLLEDRPSFPPVTIFWILAECVADILFLKISKYLRWRFTFLRGWQELVVRILPQKRYFLGVTGLMCFLRLNTKSFGRSSIKTNTRFVRLRRTVVRVY